jgi:predicted RNase H-like HicB family nuclease
MTVVRVTAIIRRKGDGYVACSPNVDIASQGSSVTEARNNLVGALTLFLETADPSEVEMRLSTELFVTQVEIPVA